ncbi:hypothetical protein [Lewinella sp. LCG006]|uniref:hypothetical protein n=1 Tax=Lewinella sp. LCG006 TaxID=3231911 RepID=UPI00346133AE
MMNLLKSIFFALLCTLPILSFTQESTDVIETTDDGLINWTQGYIEAEGFAVIDTKYENTRQAEALAKRGAVVVAKANLLETIKGVTISGETRVRDFMTESYVITAKVEGDVVGARQVGSAIVEDGAVVVRVRMPLYGAGSLADLVIDEVKAKNKTTGTASSIPEPEPTPEELEEFTTTVFKTLPTATSEGGKIVLERPADGTPVKEVRIPKIAFDFKGAKIDPALFPVIVDQDGAVLFDFSELYEKVNREYGLYLNLAREVLDQLQAQKGVEIIEAVQTSRGVFQVRIDESTKKGRFWKGVLRVGKKVLPWLIGMI